MRNRVRIRPASHGKRNLHLPGGHKALPYGGDERRPLRHRRRLRPHLPLQGRTSAGGACSSLHCRRDEHCSSAQAYGTRKCERTVSRRKIRCAGPHPALRATCPPCGARKMLRAYVFPCIFRPLRKKRHRFICHWQRDGAFPRARGRHWRTQPGGELTPVRGAGILRFLLLC